MPEFLGRGTGAGDRIVYTGAPKLAPGQPMIALTMLTLLYFLPTILASRRGHDVLAPLLLNLFFGWTVIGWLALFLWALLSREPYAFMPPGYCAARYRR